MTFDKHQVISFVRKTRSVIRSHDSVIKEIKMGSHIRPLQAANCCRNSRLAVDEDDLKGV